MPIEQLQRDDRVLGWTDHRLVVGVVTHVFRHQENTVLKLYHDDGSPLPLTPSHPVYVLDVDRFIKAGDLRPGHTLMSTTGHGTQPVQLLGVEPVPTSGPVPVYNLSVSGTGETYFADGLLVHNKTYVEADGDGYSVDGGDCDDSDPSVNPGENEVCDDGIDNDCDGLIDGEDESCPGDSRP